MTNVALSNITGPSPPFMLAGIDVAPPRPDMVWIPGGTFRMGSQGQSQEAGHETESQNIIGVVDFGSHRDCLRAVE